MKSFKLLLFLQIVLLSTSFLQETKAWDDEDDDFFNEGEDEDKVEHGHDDHDSEEVVPRAIQNSHDHPAEPAAQDPDRGFSGGNVANYNESCSMTIACNNYNNLKCVEGKCACLEAHTYIKYQEKCYPIWNNPTQRCEFDMQCHDGQAGQLSRCGHTTGKCECHDTLSSGKNTVVMYQATCVYRKIKGTHVKRMLNVQPR